MRYPRKPIRAPNQHPLLPPIRPLSHAIRPLTIIAPLVSHLRTESMQLKPLGARAGLCIVIRAVTEPFERYQLSAEP